MKLYGVYVTKATGVQYFTDLRKATLYAEKLMHVHGTAWLAGYYRDSEYCTAEDVCNALNGKKWFTKHEIVTKFVKPGYGQAKVEC